MGASRGGVLGAALVVCAAGAYGCSLLAPSDAELMGGLLDGGGGEASSRDAVARDGHGKDGPIGRDAREEDGKSTGDTGDTDGGDTGVVPHCGAAAGTVVAARAPGTITIDGNLSDWGTPTFTSFSPATAQLILGASMVCTPANAAMCNVPGYESVKFAALWDDANVYLAVEIGVKPVGGTNKGMLYEDDAVEVYLSGDTSPNGDYSPADHQYVVSWQNLVADCTSVCPAPSTPGVATAVHLSPGSKGYTVEMSIARAELGRAKLSSGDTLGFDLGVDHGSGSYTGRSLIVWWMQSHPTPMCTSSRCQGCNPNQPYCDTLDFGSLCLE